MTPTERCTQISSSPTGLSATLRVLIDRLGIMQASGVEARLRAKRTLGYLGAVTVALGLLLPIAAASADGRISGGSEGIFAQYAAGGIESPAGLAVSAKESGDIYTVDSGTGRVSEFSPTGVFVRAFGWGIVPGAATGTGDLTVGSTSVTNVHTNSGAFSTGGVGGRIITGPGIPANTRYELVTPTELTLSKPPTASATGAALTVAAGPGNVPTNETQKLSINATGGQFTLTFISPKPGSTVLTTTDISATAPVTGAGSVQEALENLGNIGPGNVSVAGSVGSYLITFQGRFADTNVRQLNAENVSLSGGSPSSEATVSTPQEGDGVVETCTTICSAPSAEENALESGEGFYGGSRPGQLNGSEEIAIDNSCAQQEPPLSESTTPTCAEFDPSYGDVYVVDQQNFRIEKYGSSGEFLLMFGGGIDKTTGANVCTAADLASGDICGAGLPGTGPGHFYEEDPPTGAGGAFAVKVWWEHGNNSIAVGPDGTVYVGDYGRIQKFKPTGVFSGELGLPDPQPQFVSSLAVSAAGDIYERSETHYRDGTPVTQIHGVREYSSSGTLLRTFDTEEATSEPTHVAVDSAGDLFVSEFKESHAGTPANGTEQDFFFRAGIRAFKPTGPLYAEVTSDQVENVERKSEGAYHPSSRNPAGLALGQEAGKLYATASLPGGSHIGIIPLPEPGPPVAKEEEVTDIQPATATLHAEANPGGFDTEYHFEYIDQEGFEDGGFSNSATQQTTSTDLGLVIRDDPVQAAISGLAPATTYHYRVVAESHCNEAVPSEVCIADGEDQSFETLPPVSVRGLTTQVVGPELVTLKAELNPNGPETTYEIHFGKAMTYSTGTSTGRLEVGNEFKKISATFTNLTPDTTYHYQLITSNSNGEVKSADQTFTTESSAAEERSVENCPNTNLREENNSLGLLDCRAYEQTTAPNKEGGEAFAATSLAPSGERLVYLSQGVFAGALANEFTVVYLAQRSPSGWVTRPIIGRPAPPGVEPRMTPNELTFSPELDRWLFGEIPAFDAQEAHLAGKSGYLSMGFADGTFIRQASPTYNIIEGEARIFDQILSQDPSYRSDDLSHLFFVTNTRLLSSDPRPDGYDQGSIAGHSDRIYEFAGVGGANPTIKLVADLPLGLEPSTNGGSQGTQCAINFDENGTRQNYAARLSSRDGSTMVYSAPIEHVAGAFCGPGTPNPFALFVHYEGESTSTQLNAVPPSQCHAPSPCASVGPTTPSFAGLLPDGTGAWFTTTQPLIDSDTDNTGDLYFAELEKGKVKKLVQVSAGQASPAHPTSGQGAGVQGVVRVSADGSHVAFVATGVLTEQENGVHQSAAQGADNLYVYDAASSETKFVARLCSGSEKSGSLADPGCPKGSAGEAGLWSPDFYHVPHAAFTPDGRYLLLSSSQRLTPDDTDDVADLFRYDFQTGQLIRVSFGRDGNDGNGNDDAYEAEMPVEGAGQFGEAHQLAEDSSRSISADGSTIIFQTAAPLVSHDTNGGKHPGCGSYREGEEEGEATGCDIYEWEEQGHGSCREVGGCIGLVSDGVDPHGAKVGVISASGRDITFYTQRGEVPGDTDGVGDIYDAREDGGFHFNPPQSPCGSPEACRPPAVSPPAVPNFTTEGNVSAGNGVQHLRCARGKVRVKKHGQLRCVARKRHRKKHVGIRRRRSNNASVGGGK